MQICLTKEGQKVVNEKIAPIIELEKKAFNNMEEKDRNLLISLTQKYVDFFNKDIEQYYDAK